MSAHARMMLCCKSYESSMHFFQKQQTLQRLCAESLNSCFSDIGLTVLSPFVSSHFLSLSHSAWAAESTHQMNTERGIVFRLETAEQVMDNGNTWKCINCGCKKKAIPVQISVGASLKSNLILEFNNASQKKMDSFEMICIQANAFLTYQRHIIPVDGGSLWSLSLFHQMLSPL